MNTKEIIYVCSKVPPFQELLICNDLKAAFPVNFRALRHVQELFQLISKSDLNADYIVVDIDDLHELQGVDFFDVIRSLSTVISCGFNINNNKKLPKIIALISELTPFNLYKDLLAIKEVDNFTLRYGEKVNYKMIKECVANYLDDNGDRPPQVISELFRRKKKHKKRR
jgi:hypothetical protein